MLLHIHKDLTDNLDLCEIAKDFILAKKKETDILAILFNNSYSLDNVHVCCVVFVYIMYNKCMHIMCQYKEFGHLFV